MNPDHESMLTALRFALAKHFPDFKSEVLEDIELSDLTAMYQLFLENKAGADQTQFLIDVTRFLFATAEMPESVEHAYSILRCFRLMDGMFADFSLNSIAKFSIDVEGDGHEHNFFRDPFAELWYEQEKILQIHGPVEGQLETYRRRLETDPDITDQLVHQMASSMFFIGKKLQNFYFQAIRDVLTDYNAKQNYLKPASPIAYDPLGSLLQTLLTNPNAAPQKSPPLSPEKAAQARLEKPLPPPPENVSNLSRKQRNNYVGQVIEDEIGIRSSLTDEYDQREMDTAYRCSQMMFSLLHWLSLVSTEEQNAKSISTVELNMQHEAREAVLNCFIYLRDRYYSTEEVLTLFQYITQDLGLAHFMNLFKNVGVKTFLSGLSAEIMVAFQYMDEGHGVSAPSEEEDRMGVDLKVTPDLAVQVKSEKNQKRMDMYDLSTNDGRADVTKWIQKQRPKQRNSAAGTMETLQRYAREHSLVPIWVITFSGVEKVLKQHSGSPLQQAYREKNK